MNQQLENKMNSVGLRIICVIFLHQNAGQCLYRVYTSDGGYTDYLGYSKVPQLIKDWLQERNTFEYTLPSCMFVSGVKVV